MSVNKSTSIIVVIEVQDAVSEAPDVQNSCIAIDSNGFATIDWIQIQIRPTGAPMLFTL